jgi:hypothetical protein
MAPFLRTIFVASFSLISSVSFAANEKHAAPAHGAAGHAARPGGGAMAHRPPAPMHAFKGHNFHGRAAWEQGKWHHENRHGRNGWWYDVDGAEYYYDQPQYPYPANISSVEFVEPTAPPEGPPMTCSEAEQVVPQVRARLEQIRAENSARNTTNGQFDFTKSALNGIVDNFVGITTLKGTCPNDRALLSNMLTEQRALYYCPKLDKGNRSSELAQMIDREEDILDGTLCNPAH